MDEVNGGIELSMRSSEDPLKKRDKGKADVGKDLEQQDSEEARLVQPGWARPVATLVYAFVSLGHVLLLKEQWLQTNAEGGLFLSLAVLQASLGFEAAIYAAGGLARGAQEEASPAFWKLRAGCAYCWGPPFGPGKCLGLLKSTVAAGSSLHSPVLCSPTSKVRLWPAS
ncbi:RFC2 [Symbiodinium pilosum]|uniref:RFC2 protein n=1 Tax=Symbiodinium pilosum TaxID=2952 RepID=A0A812TXW7_SYMPI|nr:RFC2 [Symbiodinium pilosum]